MECSEPENIRTKTFISITQQERICYFNNDICYIVCSIPSLKPYPLPILLCAARTEVWNVVLMTQENSFMFQQAGHCVQRETILRCFYYKKAARPGKFLHVFLYTRWLVAKHLVAASNVTIASQKVVSKQKYLSKEQ